MNNFFFIGLPYAVIVIMIVGSLFRYLYMGYKVSSLSSQFLEGRQLFYGSQLFHWGLVFLFFGHLIGFLFPESVLDWNGSPLRLIIIEVAALGFGILSIFGLVVLILRRITNERLHMVTTKMDAVVYIILSVQIVSGLWVALFARWGSAWFASVLSPYLKSIFVLQPDIAAVAALPLSIQIHIVSAFILIGMIPFTRFIHFLVYPFVYIWRSYQYVIWNWDRKGIRTSTKLRFGVKSRNN